MHSFIFALFTVCKVLPRGERLWVHWLPAQFVVQSMPSFGCQILSAVSKTFSERILDNVCSQQGLCESPSNCQRPTHPIWFCTSIPAGWCWRWWQWYYCGWCKFWWRRQEQTTSKIPQQKPFITFPVWFTQPIFYLWNSICKLWASSKSPFWKDH